MRTAINGYFVADSEWGYGRVLVLESSWKPSYRELLRQHAVTGLRLSFPSWPDTDLGFLAELPELRSVEVYSWNVRDASVISQLPNLQYVGLECNLSKAVDLASLKRLEVFMGAWNKHLDSVFMCSGLKHINMRRYPGTDLSLVGRMAGLTRLFLTSRKISSLDGIEHLTLLEHCTFLDCTGLGRLVGIESLRDSLRQLHIESCKRIQDVSPLAELRMLTELVLDSCGDIDTLVPLEACQNLEKLSFIGTRVIDGDLSFILKLPKLQRIFFMPRRDYSHTRLELQHILDHRN